MCPSKLHVHVQTVLQPTKCRPSLFLHLQIVFRAHDLSTCSNAESWARAHMRRMLAHVSKRRVDSCFMEFAVAARILTNQFEYARDSRSSYFDLRIDKAFPQAMQDPRMGQYTPLVGGAVRNVRENKYGLRREVSN